MTEATGATASCLFMPGEGPSTPNEYFQPSNVTETVVTDLVEWVTSETDGY
ncbi:MAG: hypothetical protein U5K28_12685 [Halobacteriales archaeon]|nr:hypothetical protein [Halobacteriales archaeon]